MDAVLTHANVAFEALREARIFVTGGTGFFGHWLLESLLHANRSLQLDIQATVLTRDAARFRARSPWIAQEAAITLLEGDVRSFDFPAQQPTHVVHAATDSGGHQREQDLAEAIVEGTRRVLEFGRTARTLYVSSGAVYGRSTTLRHTPENYLEAGEPSLPPGSYEAAKRQAETLCVSGANAAPAAVIARCFAFVGPHLPLDAHFAIGNFIAAAMAGRELKLTGDGTPRRSWLYMSDLAVWLWTMLANGEAGRAYNVGSDVGYTIAEAASLTAATLNPGLAISLTGTPKVGAPLNSYVPDIARARDELGLRVTVSLEEALRRTAAWYAER